MSKSNRSAESPRRVRRSFSEEIIRSELVEAAVDWEWSSARWYAGEENVPLQMDRTVPMVEE
ncbi:hypothetical protein [Thalassoglobus polymorphus]|uniref:Uncharacterized protein n=1 Tax=Thalassoglobus polymorphus TaxID=2527994 RepID=A0A517QIJ3_9PLAN|nr:hypothetical protein [Thalassoglobus polymorphus]QDT31452.1 hypothetical protein Mal48_06850 [Thalassoglobus polymorphus]